MVSVVGVTATDTGGRTDTVAVADLEGSATLVAVTEIVSFTVTAGAVYSPALVIVPLEADQITLLLVLLVTAAVNCWVSAENTLTCAGEIETHTAVLALAGMAARKKNPMRTATKRPNRISRPILHDTHGYRPERGKPGIGGPQMKLISCCPPTVSNGGRR